MLSYNIRGLGSKIKKREVMELIQQQGIDCCFVQETKLGSFSDLDLKLIWGSENFGYAFRQAEGRSGGILTIWNEACFSSSSQWDIPGALIINGRWNSGNIDCCLINIYAPQSCRDRGDLWDKISLVVEQNRDSCVCVVGDFNSIRNNSERVGRGTQFQTRDVQAFDNFVRNSNLVEIRLQGRKFTWYQPQGQCKTKLDRFLVNDKWLNSWPHSKARGLQRSVSDHCPILLETKVVDWGPKPFRFFNAWTNHPDFEKVVKESWRMGGITGWSCFVFKEKLKRLKEELRNWNRSTFGRVDENISNLRDEIQMWDAIDDIMGLEEEEVFKRNEAEANLRVQLNNRDNFLAQKSRTRWLKEGDVNSGFFHKAITGRRLKNEISGLLVEDTWVDEPNEVKRIVRTHFQTQFRKSSRLCPEIPENFVHKKIPDETREWLENPLMEEEIKEAVWNCDSGKSPGPDGFNFHFMKRCWETIKEDLLKVLKEFHSHGKLARRCNTSFVVLIPKKEAASDLKEFRPISLISCLYKVIAKVLASILKKVMNFIIS